MSEGKKKAVVPQISQEAFDTVVRENVSEFDMSIDEAVEDAIQQFAAQVVSLSLPTHHHSLTLRVWAHLTSSPSPRHTRTRAACPCTQ